ncbi:MAG: hypothetical protein V1878_00435 [bacterium]
MANAQDEKKESSEIGGWLVDLIKNQDQVGQKWIEFLIAIETGLVVALGFLVRTPPTQPLFQLLLYLIPMSGILAALALTGIVVRERKWQAWYVERFNDLSSYKGKVFPTVRCSIGAQPWGRISWIVILFSCAIALAWVLVILFVAVYQIATCGK